MPCRSDYPEPTQLNTRNQAAAKLIMYVNKRLGLNSPKWISEQSRDVYANDNRLVPQLCELVKSFSESQKAEIMYDAHNPKARKLADWWETHERADKERRSRKRKEKADAELFKLVIAKLSAEEIRVLVLNGLQYDGE